MSGFRRNNSRYSVTSVNLPASRTPVKALPSRRYGHKSGRVTAWKAIMTVNAAGLRGSGPQQSWVKIMHAFFSEFDKWQN